MEKQECGPGFSWDLLVKECIMEESHQPVTADTLAVRNTRAPAQSWVEVAPSVWICVGVVLSSSILALLLWFIIYRRHKHNAGKRSSEPPASVPQNGSAVSPMLPEQKEDSPLSCTHWNDRTQDLSVCELGWGQSICKGKVQHGVPVPATELGDSALVTTKTVQPIED
ncbi:tumor necrosis factor receptor superfamily member 13C-like isoform X1 [Astyanax mexicanus]|uniref:Tumor necrosis factor receptor superfamily member 13C-like n=1 Tax=Astyanax mexicanus TaxID=7994 RepID=A0A3B1JUA1_ASTMX|nr:tumor necrosis factor receptor superfamily member 13C isoform X1 [Astyanax mexicanus]XP_049329930.1 tumor necrosis factor receptor superfamily member 13C-like isoform X1 [Astyanax mexicanus]